MICSKTINKSKQNFKKVQINHRKKGKRKQNGNEQTENKK